MFINSFLGKEPRSLVSVLSVAAFMPRGQSRVAVAEIVCPPPPKLTCSLSGLRQKQFLDLDVACIFASDAIPLYYVFEVLLLLSASVVHKWLFLIPSARCCASPLWTLRAGRENWVRWLGSPHCRLFLSPCLAFWICHGLFSWEVWAWAQNLSQASAPGSHY